MNWIHSRRLQYFAGGIAILFLLFALLRFVFLFAFSGLEVGERGATAEFWDTLLIGLSFDLRLAILAMLPLALLLIFPRFNLLRCPRLRLVARTYLVLAVFGLLLLYFLDFGHYDYLGVRLNATVFRFAGNTDISTTMLWQSYPVVWITLGWALGGLAVFALFLQLEKRIFSRPPIAVSRSGWAAAWVVSSVFVFFGLMGRVTDINLSNPVPLRWSDAFFSGDARLAAIGLNPVLFLYDTSKIEEQPYDKTLVAEHYDLVADYLGAEPRDRDNLSFSRTLGPQAHRIQSDRPPNVVFVMLESLGASRVSAYGNPLETTPNLDAIARDGWFFRHFFVPVTGTAKTVWASITGIPDVSREETATRNPLITGQNTVINAFDGYEKLYMIGGAAGWANMNALVEQSIEGVTLYQEGFWKGPNVDVWGISDLQLFKEADEILRSRSSDKPFFAIIQTAGNHRPFTIPEDREDFEELNPPLQEVEQWGFRSVAQYNAVRFLDYSVGRFMEMARESGYFDNTVFVFYGDHNNRVTRLPHMPPIYEQMWLESNHVPHMIYAPKLIEPQVIDEATALMDVLPTVAGLVGLEYTTRTMGRDLQLTRQGKDRAVPLVLVEGSFPIIGAVTSEFLLKMNHDGSDPSLHRMGSDDPKEDVSTQHPETFDYLRRFTRGAYETSRYMLYDNARKD
ncbi:LTA synthase family protein [Proteobacteria bacterium 005FR1]|nr:LTA synthase family protein [Proteobacteria bacterium 005FR1]